MITNKARNINLPFVNDVSVSSNEIYIQITTNKNLEKLFKNDEYLADSVGKYVYAIKRLQKYNPYKTYNTGDVVFYVNYLEYDEVVPDLDEHGVQRTDGDGNLKTKTITHREVENLYLLRSLWDNNNNKPVLKIIDGVSTFDASGWHNENPIGTIYFNGNEDSINIRSYIDLNVQQRLSKHENNKTYHKYGKLTSIEDIYKKVLKTDFSNLDENRERIFYPDHIENFNVAKFTLNEDDIDDENKEKIITSGTYKKWTCGIIEYDIEYHLGEMFQETQHIGVKEGTSTYDISSTYVMAANRLVLTDGSAEEPYSEKYNENYRYFLRNYDYNIFNVDGSEKNIKINGIEQTNLNNAVNIFHGTINFEKYSNTPFKDLNYMIFDSGTALNFSTRQSFNKMAFTNKTTHSVTAVYIIQNYKDKQNLSLAALKNNRFRVHIIGRWK